MNISIIWGHHLFICDVPYSTGNLLHNIILHLLKVLIDDLIKNFPDFIDFVVFNGILCLDIQFTILWYTITIIIIV